MRTFMSATRAARALFLSTAFFASGAAEAQYPSRPIHMVISFAAGGTMDAIARSLATHMSSSLGQAIVVESKPGADGAVAADLVARAAPDGYTVLFATSGPFNYAPATRKTLPYDPLLDFAPVGLVCEFEFFLFVDPALPVRDVAEFVRYVKANPSKVNQAHSGSAALLFGAAFAQAHQLNYVHVPYKGDSQMAPDLLAGRVQSSFAAGFFVPFAKAGKLRALATTASVRSSLLADVPTLAETGTPALPIVSWGAMFVPAAAPREVVDRLAGALRTALARPEVRDQLASVAASPRSSTPAELGVLVKEQLVAWRRAAQAAGLHPE
jgi:tripartite-type tricarboxylate transporter receptor subunit TctC